MARSSASSSARPGSGPDAAVPRVYLDYAGFSPVDPRVVAVMRPFLEGGVGNPGAPHSLGLEARASLDGARAKVARLIGGAPSGVIFTASATEANNLAIKGVAARARGRHIVTSAVEHVSVLNACRDLEKQGFAVSYVPVDAEGRPAPDAVAGWMRGATAAPGDAAHGRARRGPPAAPRVLRGARREGGRRPARARSQRHRRLVRLGVQRGHGRALPRAPRDRLRPRGARGLPLLHART